MEPAGRLYRLVAGLVAKTQPWRRYTQDRGIPVNAIRHVVFRGRVQGVGFRAYVEDAAAQHGVEGWVRNRRDGTVEAVFAGPADVVDAAIEACRSGPRFARVDAADVREAEPAELALRGDRDKFAVLPTV
jgi:acylphosphatase